MAPRNAGNTGPTKAQAKAAERDWNQRVAIANSPENLQSIATFTAAEKVRTSAQPVPATSTVSVNDPNSASNVQKQADDAQKLRDQTAEANQAARDKASEDRRVQNATSTMQALLAQYNLSSLYNTVVNYVIQGYDAEAISVLIRTTPEYKTRFPAMEALSQKGRAISEASYIDYEQQAAALEQRYGLPSGMLMNNVTGLLTNDVSATELNDRVILASAASIQAPQELKDTFKNYYGIDAGGLTGYFLDPNVAAPLLEKQYATTLIGSEAVRQGLAVDVNSAENLQSLGITQDQARQGFTTVAGASGLTKGAGDVTSQQELISGTLAGNATAQQNIDRVAASRAGRFQKGGQFLQTKEGNVGLGSAATR